MQEPRRWRGLQLNLLSLVAACSAAPAPAPTALSPSDAPATLAEASVPPTAASAASEAPREAAPTGAAVTAAPPAAALAELPAGTKVLQVGDSFAAALGIELGKRLKAAGVRTSLEFKTASYVPTWAFGPELPKLISSYQPDLVLVTLGANELEIPDPAQRAGAVQRLVKKLGDRPCVWILPPLWKQDTGLMQVIKDNSSPCKVLDSSALVKDLPRGPDNIHPNAHGREVWADAVFQWLKQAREPGGPKPWSLRDVQP
jgi:hypothetical protein